MVPPQTNFTVEGACCCREQNGLTQAAVSAQVQRPEAELGFEIFDRRGRSAHLIRMGQPILLQAQELLRLYDNLVSSTVGL